MEEKLLECLNNHARELASVTDGDNFDDLMPLCEVLKNVRIVGLGESTHGTREFFQIKHRIVRFLVEKMGFRYFTIEAGVMPCMNINDYVMMGKGDRAKALASQGYWCWDTEEVTAMIEWMRQHNLSCSRGDECQFIGFDIKPIGAACDTLRHVVKQVCEETYLKVDALLHKIQNMPFPYNLKEPISTDEIIWLLGWLTAREIVICERTGRSSYELAIKSCRMIYQFIEGSLIDFNNMSRRDKHMAENISLLLNTLPPDAKIIVWAHNAHVAVDAGFKSLGWQLRQRYGDKYYTFGLTYKEGTFQSRLLDKKGGVGPLMEFDAGSLPEISWEYDLSKIKYGNFYMDLRNLINSSEEGRKWAKDGLRKMRAIGAGFDPENNNIEMVYSDCILGDKFDGLIHLQKTSRARPTPTGNRDKEGPSK